MKPGKLNVFEDLGRILAVFPLTLSLFTVLPEFTVSNQTSLALALLQNYTDAIGAQSITAQFEDRVRLSLLALLPVCKTFPIYMGRG